MKIVDSPALTAPLVLGCGDPSGPRVLGVRLGGKLHLRKLRTRIAVVGADAVPSGE